LKKILRWGVKKSTRRAVALASWLTGLAPNAPSETQPVTLRALTYHRFGNAQYDPFCVSPTAFEAQMAFLARHNLAVSLAQLQQFLAGSERPLGSRVLVTIDDGHLSSWSIAMPILKKYRIPAVAFVTPDTIGNRQAADATIPEGYAGWSELEEMIANGIDVASHSLSHRSLGAMQAAEASDEATRSKAMLEDRLGISVSAFAYPYGTLADFNPLTARILQDAGYRVAFTSQHGAVTSDANALELPRIKVEGGEPLWMFRLATRGALDQWKWVDRTLWRLQSSPAAHAGDRFEQCL
jgi:peptidoglycan/xylan/chitin deacetylase (PgdA/CDA1 family)